MNVKHCCEVCDYFFDNQCCCNESQEFLSYKENDSKPCDEFEIFESEDVL